MVKNSNEDLGSLPPTISRPTWLGKATRKSVSEEEIKKAKEEIEKNPDYEKNGWSPENLAIYFKEQTQAQSDRALNRNLAKPRRTRGWHNGHKWRR